jgi:23S rRNA pseudouridine2605 synthase
VRASSVHHDADVLVQQLSDDRARVSNDSVKRKFDAIASGGRNSVGRLSEGQITSLPASGFVRSKNKIKKPEVRGAKATASQPDPMKTSFGYIGADTLTRQRQSQGARRGSSGVSGLASGTRRTDARSSNGRGGGRGGGRGNR